MKYAVVKVGGRQYKVIEGQVITVEDFSGEKDKSLIIDTVLMHVSDGAVVLGNPYLADTTVKATPLEVIKGKKVHISKFKSKVRYRRSIGHRKLLSKLRIDSIEQTKAPAKAKKA